MTHHLVDACTYTHREGHGLFVATIVQTGGNSPMLSTKVTTDTVNLKCRHARTNRLTDSVQHARIDHAGTSDASYLFIV